MDGTLAMMVFLSCAPGAVDCREIQGAHSYQDPAACREALPAVLKSMNRTGRHVIGRCTLASETNAGLDQITTGSIGSDARTAEGYVVVRVTRLKDGLPETTSYQVPQVR